MKFWDSPVWTPVTAVDLGLRRARILTKEYSTKERKTNTRVQADSRAETSTTVLQISQRDNKYHGSEAEEHAAHGTDVGEEGNNR